MKVMKRTDECNAVGRLVARDTMHHLTHGNVQGGAHVSIQADMAKRDKCTVGLFEQFYDLGWATKVYTSMHTRNLVSMLVQAESISLCEMMRSMGLSFIALSV